MDFTVQANTLTITATPEERQEATAYRAQGWGDDAILGELFEKLFCNSSWDWVTPEEVGALTDSPLVSQEAQRDDFGDITTVGQVFYDPHYMVRSLVDTLIETGTATMEGSN